VKRCQRISLCNGRTYIPQLDLVPPIGILAAWTYYKHGYVDLSVAGYLCLGFFIGGLLGAKIATNIPNVLLEKIFGVALLIIAIKMILAK
jgi:hypothetical protein